MHVVEEKYFINPKTKDINPKTEEIKLTSVEKKNYKNVVTFRDQTHVSSYHCLFC